MAHFVGKDRDKNLVVWLIKKYNLTRGGCAYDVAQIEEKPLRFIVQLLARKVLRKCRPNQVSGPAIELAYIVKDGL